MVDLCVLPRESTKTAITQAEKNEFLAAYQELHEPLMRFCMVKSRGIMDAKDLVNDVLLIGLENYAKLSEKKALLSYLFTSANRICLNKIRRRKFAGVYHEKDINILEDYSSDPSEKADVSFLYEALDQLPELQKEALILFEISDLPIKEIMTIQNSGESAVKQRIKRGKEKLAELLGEKEKRKIAVLIPLFITSQSFGMTHLDLYFQAFKSLPLPLSASEASATIVQFTTSGTAITPANYTVMLPATVNLDIRGHYKTITLPDRLGNLKTDLYETMFTCGSVAGEGDLTLHYSKAEMGNFEKLKLSLFEGTANLKNADEFDLECKYATVNTERVTGSKLQMFESKFNAQQYRGALTANLKYSSVNFTKSELSASTIVAFESRINIPSFSDLTLDLRYSTLTSDVIKDLTLSVGFESKFYLGSVNSIVAESSKYCTYTISSLGGRISMDSFEDRLTITKSSLAPMNFAGKYSTYTINLSQPSNYRLKLDVNYCKLNYVAHPLKITGSEQTNEHKILEGFFGNANNDSPLISFDCFESSINLN